MSRALQRIWRDAALAGITVPLVASALVGCAAAPPLQLYTLSEPLGSTQVLTSASNAPPRHGGPVIQIVRVRLPEYLDSPDLLVRQGDTLKRSSTGRWASRLSLAATDLLTARIMMREAGTWVTDQPPARTPDYRLLINIRQLDITSSGAGIVQADWEIVPRCSAAELVRRRTQFTVEGSVATDQDVARFERSLIERLAAQIDVPDKPPSCRRPEAAAPVR